MAPVVTVASVAVPVFAAALFGVSALLQGSLLHTAFAFCAVVLAVTGAVLYVRHKDDDDADVPTTGQTVVLALSVVLLMAWLALLITTVRPMTYEELLEHDYGDLFTKAFKDAHE